MAYNVASSYGPGVSTTTASGGDRRAQDYLEALLSREARAPAPRPARGARFGSSMPRAKRATITRGDPLALQKELEARAQLRQAAVQRRALESPPPMRMVSGPGITPGYVMDPNRMNAYQREAYLPQSAQYGGMLPPSQAGLAFNALLEREPEPESSPFGFDYLPPLEQARYIEALARSNAPRRR